MERTTQPTIAVVGLGYVGLPLALRLATCYSTIGFDIDSGRVEEIHRHHDRNQDVDRLCFTEAEYFKATDQCDALFADIYILTLPTPIKADNHPDLSFMEDASILIGRKLKPGDLVIYESTVYPCATEEVFIPILERESGLLCNEEFGVGYSPERINPGDTERRIQNIVKITSGSNAYWASHVDSLYASIIDAGTHQAPSIKVAEAAKVIENTQRDLNIALVNELAQLFSVLQIDTRDVLDAACTKWNFYPFFPGLVGGHCISIDPYYLCHKAKSVGYKPNIIQSGRRLNEGMPAFIANEAIKLLLAKQLAPFACRVLILGFAFKENCSDTRNSKVIQIVEELAKYQCQADVHDPLLSKTQAVHYPSVHFVEPEPNTYDLVIVAVAHDVFIKNWSVKYAKCLHSNGVVYDIKACLPREWVDKRL